MKKYNKYLFGLIIVVAIIVIVILPKRGYMPKSGMVPSSTIVIEIAEAVLIPIYGETQILQQKPYVVTYNSFRKTWKVEGGLLLGALGGVFEIIIRKTLKAFMLCTLSKLADKAI